MKETMKTKMTMAILAMLALAQAAAALAASPEDCWTDGPGRVAGNFRVSMDTSTVTKDELLQTLAKFSINQNVYAIGFPLVATAQNYISFELAPSGVWTSYNSDGTVTHEPQNELEARVNAEIRKLQTLPGVQQITCAQHAVPHPGVSGSN